MQDVDAGLWIDDTVFPVGRQQDGVPSGERHLHIVVPEMAVAIENHEGFRNVIRFHADRIGSLRLNSIDSEEWDIHETSRDSILRFHRLWT